MYRIKTDIRQYKCESIDKVEKLIRNWVIRPNDLIYSSDDRDWLPIGDHPSFEKLFGILEEREAAEPDTVVTDDHPLLRNGTPVRAEVEEATQITERPEFVDDEDDDEDEDHDEAMDSRETDIFDADQIAESLAERDRAEADGAPEEAPEDHDDDEDASDELPNDDLEDEEDEDITNENLDDVQGSEPLAPPTAPEGVEPPVNDEITVMTDKTLEMMKIEDGGGGDSDDEAGPEEATQVTERPTEEEATQVTERPTEDEPTQVAERPTGSDDQTSEIDAPSDDDETEQKVIVAAPDEPGKSDASKGVGRHDLPEEFFATNEISGPVFEESAKVIDDLAAMEAERTAAENVDDAWDEISDDLDSKPDKPALGLRDTDEIAGEAGEDDGDDDESVEEAAIAAADEWDEDVSRVESETTDPAVVPVGEFISDGYKMPLPFEVGPNAQDVALGLKRSSKSNTAKDAAFPYPKPKKRGEVHARVYYFSEDEPRDLSIPIVIGIVVILSILATLAVC